MQLLARSGLLPVKPCGAPEERTAGARVCYNATKPAVSMSAGELLLRMGRPTDARKPRRDAIRLPNVPAA